MQTLKIKVSGIVQGVFFRQATRERAFDLNIKGTVRNCEDDTVEIIATAENEQLAKLIEWCWEGPPRAKVIDVSSQELSLQLFNNFSIIR